MTLRILLPALLFFFACHSANKQPTSAAPVFAERPKNIILLIGDGMAVPQISAGLYWKGVGKSVWEQFGIVGFHKSHSHDEKVTDSAAGATAFSCGNKTNNGAIGVLPPNNEPCRTILEELDAQGWATGMVVTCSATHATPASFIAHQDIRAFTESIAKDYLNTALDCFVGGGSGYFDDRPDKKNLLDSFRNRGYVIRKGEGFGRLPMDGSAPFMLFTAEREPGTASAGRGYLPGATHKVCEYLQKRSNKGFFLMVEGSQIDWALHANDRNWLKAEMLDFDATVTTALNFARADGNTLVIVTGDHECGGTSLNAGDSKKNFRPGFASRMHSASMVPVFAFGPKADLFAGIYDNTAIYSKMWAALGKGAYNAK